MRQIEDDSFGAVGEDAQCGGSKLGIDALDNWDENINQTDSCPEFKEINYETIWLQRALLKKENKNEFEIILLYGGKKLIWKHWRICLYNRTVWCLDSLTQSNISIT